MCEFYIVLLVIISIYRIDLKDHTFDTYKDTEKVTGH